MKIFLTGASGFLGSYVLKLCLERGHKVIASTRKDIIDSGLPKHFNLQWLQCKLDEVPSPVLDSCDALIHLAAHSVTYPFDDISSCIYENLTRPLALLEKSRLAGIRRFIIAGSCFEYGSVGEITDNISTSSALKPTNSYGVSKALASIAFTQWANQYNLNLEVLRIFHLFGEGEPQTRFWPSLKTAALSGNDYSMTMGEQIRDFMEVGNVAEMFVDRVEIEFVQRQGGCIYNLSSGTVFTLKEFAKYWWNEWNAAGHLKFGEVPYRPNEVMRFIPGPDALVVKPFLDKP